MPKTIKARKHALRKAVTAAVLMGTAVTTVGGALGTTTTVKAEEGKLRDFIIGKAAERRLNYNDEKILSDVKEYLKTLPFTDIQSLLLDLDNARTSLNKLRVLETGLGTFRNENKKDIYRNGWTLTSLLIREAQRRISEEQRLSKEEQRILKELKNAIEQLGQKDNALSSLNDKIERQLETLKEKDQSITKLTDDIHKKEKEIAEKSAELKVTKEQRESLATELVTTRKGRDKALKKVAIKL
ncbi:TPA: hypothetical protein VJK55_001403 [Streptococcus pyogenes]|nr:hypothetical protein [Streptococcus pyogenes]